MVKVSRLLKDYSEAGALNERVAVWGFVDDHTFLTKAGAVGLAFRLAPVDPACLESAAQEAIVRRFEQALRQLDDSCRLYQYLVKRPATVAPPSAHPNWVVHDTLRRRSAFLGERVESLFEYESYAVLLYEGWRSGASTVTRTKNPLRAPGETLRRRLSASHVMTLLDGDLHRAVTHLHGRAQAFAAQLTDTVRPTLLPKREVFRFLRHLLNPSPHKAEAATLKHDAYVDFFVADSTVECERDALQIDGYRLKVLTMKEPPGRTFAHVLSELLAIPSRCVACLEWVRVPHARVRREIHGRRRHFFNKKVSVVNYLNSATKPEEMLSDDSAAATVHELGQALTELEVHGHVFGECSLSVVLCDRDPRRLEQSLAVCLKAFVAHDGAVFEETYNCLNAWLATMPGNSAENVRRLTLLNTNCADLSFLFAPPAGEKLSAHLGGACLAAMEAEHQALYHWNLHYGDVGHALVLGATGSGKSFLINFLLAQAQQYQPATFVFDLGGSYERLTAACGGTTWRLGRDRTLRINPFRLPPTPEHLHFLQAFVRVLLESGGHYACTARDEREIADAVAGVYSLDVPQRRLQTVAFTLPRALGQYLASWVSGGVYADVFDNDDDTLTLGAFQAFEFQGLDAYPRVVEALLFYVLYRTNTVIRHEDSRSRLKLFLLDEAWRFTKDATVTAYIVEALKTWRKHNAALLLVTQSDGDLAGADLLQAALENCPTKVFLANPGIDLGQMCERFHLNAREAQRIVDLRPREQCLLKRPDLSTVLSLHVDPVSAALFTNRPLHVSKERLA
jgi:type IV secretion system protein VirB4